LRLLAFPLGKSARAAAQATRVPPAAARRRLPQYTPADDQQAEVFVLEGCVMPELFGDVNRATVAVLARLGTACHVRSEHVCCGALHAHNGDLENARELARETIAAFESDPTREVVVNSAGCGAHMKEYGRLLADDAEWSERARRFAERVVDFSEYCARPATLERLSAACAESTGEVTQLTFDDPCHLCHGQQIREAPRTLLAAARTLELRELPDSESCCGSAGIYSMLRPTESAAILAGKLEQLERTKVDLLVTANPGCHMQWESGLRQASSETRVRHIAQVLAAALSGRDPRA